MSNSLQYAELLSLLGRLGAGDEAARYHGALCGALCRETPQSVDPMSLLDDAGIEVDEQSARELIQLREQSVSSFTDAELGFKPLLPDDTNSLNDRAQALGQWCEGFLFGLSARKPFELKDCSEEVREIVSDFTQFTRAAIGAGDDLEVEEGAYAELVEYIRVGAQLVYMELHPRPLAAADAESYNKTLH